MSGQWAEAVVILVTLTAAALLLFSATLFAITSRRGRRRTRYARQGRTSA
jgi:hypothetical protein